MNLAEPALSLEHGRFMIFASINASYFVQAVTSITKQCPGTEIEFGLSKPYIQHCADSLILQRLRQVCPVPRTNFIIADLLNIIYEYHIH